MSFGTPTNASSIAHHAFGPSLEPPLPLWIGQDPNRHKIGVYDFQVDGADFKKMVLLADIPHRPAPTMALELTNSTLRCRSLTTDGLFEVSSSLLFPASIEVGELPVTFAVSRPSLIGLAEHQPSALGFFTFDNNEQSFSCTFGDKNRTLCIGTKRAPPLRREEAGHTLARLFPESLAEGIGVASIFLTRQLTKPTKRDGIGVSDRSVRGGYLRGISRYNSADLPEALAMTAPKMHCANLRSILSRIQGEVDVIEFDDRIHVRGRNAEISWKKGGNWPLSGDTAPFDRPSCFSCAVDTLNLTLDLGLISILFEDVRVCVEGVGDAVRIKLSGESKKNNGYSKLPARMIGESSAAIEPWDMVFNSKDFLAAASVIRTKTTEMKFLDRAIILQTIGSDAECQVALLGADPK